MRCALILICALCFSGCAVQTPLTAKLTGDGTHWVVETPLVYEDPKTKEEIVVPRGFVTDLASVPRAFWMAFPPCGKYTPAAVVHDYLYWTQPARCDRKCADDVLLDAMEGSDVDLVTRNAIYAAVRAGGGGPWKRSKKARDSGVVRFVPEELMDFGPNDKWADIERRIKLASQPKISLLE